MMSTEILCNENTRPSEADHENDIQDGTGQPPHNCHDSAFILSALTFASAPDSKTVASSTSNSLVMYKTGNLTRAPYIQRRSSFL
jgi:hypothetical protein